MRKKRMGFIGVGIAMFLTAAVASASPINFATFNGASATWTNNGNVSGDLVASGPLTFDYNQTNIAGLPTDLQAPIHALVSLSAHTVSTASNQAGRVYQPFLNPGGGPGGYEIYVMTFTVDDAYYALNPTGGFDGSGYGSLNRTDLLTIYFVTHSDQLSGVNRGTTGSWSGNTALASDGSFDPSDDGNFDYIVYDSEFLNFGTTSHNAFSHTFTQFNLCVSRDTDTDPCTAPTGSTGAFLNSSVGPFVLNGGFDSDPAAEYANVPEPGTMFLGLTGIALLLVGGRGKRLQNRQS